MNRFIKAIGTLFTVLVFSSGLISCQIGLGEAIDLASPVLTVTEPAVLSSVPETFRLAGTATDNNGITKISVQIEETGQQYKWENSAWYKYSNGAWLSYSDASAAGNNTSLTWAVTIDIEGAQSAKDYTIVTQIYDEMGNEGKASKDERSVTVDIVTPTVSIISPVLTKTYSSALSSFSSYTLKDNNVLQYLMNGDFTISGSQKEDTSLNYLLVYLDEGTTTDVPSYAAQPDLTQSISAVYAKSISGESLRNWEFQVNLSELPSDYTTVKKLVRIITESHDTAGNVERKVQGWFTYWNQADIPWISAQFGDTSLPADLRTITKVYPSCTLQGQTYDDDGLSEVVITTTVYDSNTGTWDDDNKSVVTYNLAAKNYPTYYAWSTAAISENKIFKVEISCKDKYGNSAESQTRYMGISDVMPPTLKITSPSNGDTVLGDASGNFTITGSIVDDGQIPADSLTMVRIQNRNKNQMLDYFNSSYTGWTTDTDGNKLFSISLSAEAPASGGYYTKTFSKTFNIFSDFGISADEIINTQNFVFRAVDVSGSATIESFTLQGDTEAPVITIDSVTVIHPDNTKKTYTFAEFTNRLPTLEPYNKSSGDITDKIQVSGTWSDNSYNTWHDVSKIGKINLSIPVFGTNLEITPGTDGTWSAGSITPKESSTVSISADITDLGGNKTKTSETFYVNNGNPELVRISSTTSDGSYKAGASILITMEYNKKVTFTGSGAILTLNNGGTATYKEGNGSAKHIYEYIAGSSVSEDISVLDVISINKNNCTWKDSDKAEVLSPETLPLDGAKLKDLHSICIDNTVPELQSLSAITSSGYYKLNSEIFVQVIFSEDVYFSDVSKVKLNFNTGRTSDSVTKTGARNLLFKYTVKASDLTDLENSKILTVSSIDFGSSTVQDKAGNLMTAPSLNSAQNLSTAGIYIDTKAPATPVVSVTVNDSAISDGKTVYYDGGAKVTISGFENIAGTVKKYSTDGGSSWNNYTDAFTITTNGDYTITAYQEDVAGNISGNATFFTFKIDRGTILSSITSTLPDGTYTEGKVIPIKVRFRKNVVLDTTKDSDNKPNSKLELNVSNTSGTCYAYYSEGSGTTTVTYNYTVKAGDSTPELKIKSRIGSIKDEAGNDISAYTSLPASGSGNRLEDNRSIAVVTGNPVVNSIEIATISKVDYLKITFSSKINKGSGNITLEQDYDSYKAPALLTAAKYSDFKSNSVIKAKYTAGTNGASSAGVSDLVEKYILDFETDVSDDTLKAAFKSVGALKITASVNSSNISIGTSDSNINASEGTIMYVKLTDALALPVKGADYKITVPAGIVHDDLGNSNTAKELTKNYAGVEKTVIRIKKTQETISGTQITQPLTAKVKMDCQTPGAVIYYSKAKKDDGTYTYATFENTYSNIYPKIHSSKGLPGTPATVTVAAGTKYEGEFTEGSSDTSKGYKVFLRANATTDNGTTWAKDSDGNLNDAYEVAYRTVIIFNDAAGGDGYSYRYIRGGDATSGGNSTSDFPFSWNNTDFDKIRIMTSSDSNNWYFVSWNINTTAYVGFIAGDLPDDAATYGPMNWCWGSCAWVNYKSYTPVYPGESFTFSSAYTGFSGGNFGYQSKHREYREGSGSSWTVGSGSTVPSSAKEIFSGSVTYNSSALKSFSVDTSFNYKEGTILYIYLSNSLGWCNLCKSDWSHLQDLGAISSPYATVTINASVAEQLKNGSIYIQTSGAVTITSIKAYNK